MMNRKHYILLPFLCLYSCLNLNGQTFRCDGRLLLSFNQGSSPQQLYRITFGPFGVLLFESINTYRGAHFDALGYNSVDNYIYAVRSNSNEIVRLKSDNTFEVVGTVSGVDRIQSTAGDCTIEGHYLYVDNELDKIYVYDIINGFELIKEADLVFDAALDITGPFTARLDDIAVDPNNPGIAYSFQGDYFDSDLDPFETRGAMLSIVVDINDPKFGSVTPISRVPTDQMRRAEALMFTERGGFFGYAGRSERATTPLRNLFQINPFTGVTSEYTIEGPSALNADGCSCPYSLSFTNNAEPRDVRCVNSNVTYTLTASNGSYNLISGASIIDTLPAGMIIESITGEYNGSLLSGTGVGTRYLELTGVSLPPRSSITISLNVRIDEIEIDFIGNQAHLTNLPEVWGREMISDDPQTTSFVGDATDVRGFPQDIAEVQMDVTHPTDCINSTGQAELTSSLFIPEEEYLVRLRDEEFEVIDRVVTADGNNSFLLDTLPAGEYELFQITPQSAKCSFAVRDTTLDLIAPNERVQATATSNSPICEGVPLELKGTMSPEGSITWTGPSAFIDKRPSLVIDTVTADYTGEYIMTARYGGCKQVRYLDIVVAPKIEAEVMGEDDYCERDRITLSADGIGELRSYQWSRPDGLISGDSLLIINSAELIHDGVYQLVVSNGFCTDTAVMDVAIRPAPSVSMPSLIVSDFCERLILRPEYRATEELVYEWAPSLGLDCDDCPYPKVDFPIQDFIDLKVTADNSCIDSTTTRIVFDKDKLIYVPNAFSTSAQGDNSMFKITPGCGVKSIQKLTIIDRWGASIFSMSDIEVGELSTFWDGSIAGRVADPGVYLWVMDIELITGEIIGLSGDVTLLP